MAGTGGGACRHCPAPSLHCVSVRHCRCGWALTAVIMASGRCCQRRCVRIMQHLNVGAQQLPANYDGRIANCTCNLSIVCGPHLPDLLQTAVANHHTRPHTASPLFSAITPPPPPSLTLRSLVPQPILVGLLPTAVCSSLIFAHAGQHTLKQHLVFFHQSTLTTTLLHTSLPQPLCPPSRCHRPGDPPQRPHPPLAVEAP